MKQIPFEPEQISLYTANAQKKSLAIQERGFSLDFLDASGSCAFSMSRYEDNVAKFAIVSRDEGNRVLINSFLCP